jgi:hypothetical protein
VTEAKDEKRCPSTLLIGNSGEIFAREGNLGFHFHSRIALASDCNCAAFIAIGVHRVPA